MSKDEISALNALRGDNLAARHAASDAKMLSYSQGYDFNQMSARDMQEHTLLTMRAHQEGLITGKQLRSSFSKVDRVYRNMDRPMRRGMMTFHNDAVKRIVDIQAQDLGHTANVRSLSDYYSNRSSRLIEGHKRVLGQVEEQHRQSPVQRPYTTRDYPEHLGFDDTPESEYGVRNFYADVEKAAQYKGSTVSTTSSTWTPRLVRTESPEMIADRNNRANKDTRTQDARKVARYMAGI